MNIKQFLKPTIFKIVLFLIIFLFIPAPFFFRDMSLNWEEHWITTPPGGIIFFFALFGDDPLGIEIIITVAYLFSFSYLLSCLFIYILNKFKDKSIKGYSIFAILGLIFSIINLFFLRLGEGNFAHSLPFFFTFLLMGHLLVITFFIVAFIQIRKFRLNGFLFIICGIIIALFTSFWSFISFLGTAFL